MRAILLFTLVVLASGAELRAIEPVAAPPRPNVIVILAGHHCYECLGADGGTSYQTPNLDRLAAGGVRFEHCYARADLHADALQLMTGQSNVRNYVRFGELEIGDDIRPSLRGCRLCDRHCRP